MTPLSRVVAYSAAKAAVINLTKFLAREWAGTASRVNAISPGFFPAEQNRTLLFKHDGSYTERGSQIIQHTPMARFGEAKELAGPPFGWRPPGVVVCDGAEYRGGWRLLGGDDLKMTPARHYLGGTP